MESEQSRPEAEPVRLPFAVALTSLAGFVDAVGFVRLHGLFVSFMSGNSTQIGAQPSLGHGAEALGAAALVLLFVMGAFAGGLVSAAAGAWRRPALLLLVAVLLVLAASTPLLDAHSPGAALALQAAAMTLSMGVANSVLHKAGEARVTPTYVTGTLVSLGHALAEVVQGRAAPWAAYLLMWLGLVAGGAVGAFAAATLGATALLIPAALAALLALLAGVWVRREQAGKPT